mmetsp:Transcript_38542/g.96750  ORF Transcript_38542/g.96750 Transcript_38542/m.96750 type:complete len:242 (+) Transcript_38542:354-1079(+)
MLLLRLLLRLLLLLGLLLLLLRLLLLHLRLVLLPLGLLLTALALDVAWANIGGLARLGRLLCILNMGKAIQGQHSCLLDWCHRLSLCTYRLVFAPTSAYHLTCLRDLGPCLLAALCLGRSITAPQEGLNFPPLPEDPGFRCGSNPAMALFTPSRCLHARCPPGGQPSVRRIGLGNDACWEVGPGCLSLCGVDFSRCKSWLRGAAGPLAAFLPLSNVLQWSSICLLPPYSSRGRRRQGPHRS